MTDLCRIRSSVVSWPVLAVCFLACTSVVSSLFAHDEGGQPHQGNPPLHAQDTMRAFQNDHHEAESLSSMTITSCAGGVAGGYPCSNVDLMAFLPLDQIGGGSGTDIWGWTDPQTGKEYAIMGRTSGTSFVDVSDPVNPVYLGTLPPHAADSSWRDIKVYADHAFMVSEANQSGMQVFDLRQLRNVASPPVTFSETAWYNGFLTAHNLAINEDSGYAYAVGSNTCSGGMHMINIQDPTNPTSAGCYSGDGYTHDAQCVTYHGPDTEHQGSEICFNSNEDTLTIVDVTSKQAPVLLSRTGYSGSRYTHQGWLTEDQVHFLVDDELDEYYGAGNTRTYIWDVSDLDNPINTGYHTGTTAAIDHNQYIKGEYSYQANYRAGLRILDISQIANAILSEVAYFDIYPSSDSPNFNGAWSNYPFFTSGIVVVSGIEQGLFILKPNLGTVSNPPSVTIVSPSEDSTVSGDVNVQIDATDVEDVPGSLAVQWNVSGGAWQPAAYNGGTGYYEATWATTETGNGPQTIHARATDSSNRDGTDSNNVTVSNPLPSFHIDAIEVSAVHVSGPRYQGEATVTLVDGNGSPVSGVTVNGEFSGDSSGSGSSTSDAAGLALFQSPVVKNGSNWTFCVTGASLSGWTYDSATTVEGCDSTSGGSEPPGAEGAIKGTITDASGTKLDEVLVMTDTGQSALTNKGGKYSIQNVPEGSRTVTVSKTGYATQQQTVTVTAGQTLTLDFTL